MEAISSKHLRGRFNKNQVITYHRDNNQENISIFNQIRHVQETMNKLIGPTKKPATPDNIGGVVKSPLRYEWYDSILTNDEKM